jgi:hypothetical protein
LRANTFLAGKPAGEAVLIRKFKPVPQDNSCGFFVDSANFKMNL